MIFLVLRFNLMYNSVHIFRVLGEIKIKIRLPDAWRLIAFPFFLFLKCLIDDFAPKDLHPPHTFTPLDGLFDKRTKRSRNLGV